MNIDEYLKEVSRCDKIVAVSNPCCKMLGDAMPNLESKLVTIHNMVDEDLIRQKAKWFDPNYDDTLINIVSVGRLAPEKHFENAIYAAKKLKDHNINFRWHLIGDGTERNYLEKLASDLDVAKEFVFEGNQPNPYPYMVHADLFVHPSYVESFGIVVAEALALGLPCVVTKSIGVMEFLIDGENAILTEQNPEDLSNKIMQVIQNDRLQNSLRDNACCPKVFEPNSIMLMIDKILV